MDPNWFYSTLAQCGAAIVGILGGILVTRLQRQIVEAQDKYRSYEQWRRTSFDNLADTKKAISDYVTELDDVLARGVDSLQSPGTPATVGIRHRFPTPKTDITRTNQAATRQLLNSQIARRQIAVELGAVLDGALRREHPHELPAVLAELQSLAVRAGEDGPSILWDWPAQLQAIIDTAQILRDTASSGASVAVLVILTTLCLSGIVVPLSLLFAPDHMTKVVLLTAFTFGLMGLVGYIGYQVTELRGLEHPKLARPAGTSL